MTQPFSSSRRIGSSRPASPPSVLRDEDTINRLVELLELLADRSRLRIVFTLNREGEQNVTTLCSLLGQSQPAVSHHLTRLLRSGLVKVRRQGKHNFYSLAPAGLCRFLEPLLSDPANKGKPFRLGEIVVSLEGNTASGGR